MEELPTRKCYEYTPTEQDREYAKNVSEVINALPTRMKSGDIDNKTREVIDGHFFDSMQVCFDEYFESSIDLEALNKEPYITLFEAAFLIGSRINQYYPECILTYSAGLFADAFLSREVDPRHPLTRAKYSGYQPPPRVGMTCKIWLPT